MHTHRLCNLARVSVRVLVVDVVCVMLVLIARVVVVQAGCRYTIFVANFSVVRDVLFTPLVTVNCVSCHRIDRCNFAPNSL